MQSIPQIAKKYMDLLPPSADGSAEMPMPNFQIVNNLVCRWHGIAIFQDGETVIKIQKKVSKDEKTLNRIIAHEICHAWAYWKSFQIREYPEIKGRGHESNSAWYEAAKIINQREGSNFVTETSDESYVETQERAFYVYVEFGGTGIWWSWFARIDDNLRRNLMTRAARCLNLGGSCTVFKTTDGRFLLPGAKLPTTKRLSNMPEDMTQKIHDVIRANPIREEDVDANRIISRARTASERDIDETLERIKSPGLIKLKEKMQKAPMPKIFVVTGVELVPEDLLSPEYWIGYGLSSASKQIHPDEKVTIVDVGSTGKVTKSKRWNLPTLQFIGGPDSKILFTGKFGKYKPKAPKTGGRSALTQLTEKIKSPGLLELKRKVIETKPKFLFIPGIGPESIISPNFWLGRAANFKNWGDEGFHWGTVVEVSDTDEVELENGYGNGYTFRFRGNDDTKIVFYGKIADFLEKTKTGGYRAVRDVSKQIKSPGLTELKRKMEAKPKILVLGFGSDPTGVSRIHRGEGLSAVGPRASYKLWEGSSKNNHIVIIRVGEDEIVKPGGSYKDYPILDFRGNENTEILFDGTVGEFEKKREQIFKTAGDIDSVTHALDRIKSPGLLKLKKKMKVPPKILVMGFGETKTGVIRVTRGESLVAFGPNSVKKLPRLGPNIVIVEVSEAHDEVGFMGAAHGLQRFSFMGSTATKILFSGTRAQYAALDPKDQVIGEWPVIGEDQNR